MTGPGARDFRRREKSNAALAEASLLLAAFFVGTDFVSVKYVLEGLPPLVPLSYVVTGILLPCEPGEVGSAQASGRITTLPVLPASKIS